jgi:hypothetical protein
LNAKNRRSPRKSGPKKWKNLYSRRFCHAGKHEAAVPLAGLKTSRKWTAKRAEFYENHFPAAASAEADCPETASKILGFPDPQHDTAALKIFLETGALQGIGVRYGVVMVG